MFDIIEIWYVGRQWCPELIPYIEKFLPVLIFKMAATIRKNSTLSDIIKIWYVGSQWYPELIPDIEKFLPVAIFKMADTIPHKFNIVRFQRPEYYFVSHLICIFFLRSTYLGSFSLNLTKCSNSIQFNVLFKSHLSITGHTTQIKQSYNNKLESHSLQNYKRL